MEVKLKKGESLKAFGQYPPGSPLNPISREELRKKFSKLAVAVLPDDRIDQIMKTVDKLETLDDCSKLQPMLVQASDPSR